VLLHVDTVPIGHLSVGWLGIFTIFRGKFVFKMYFNLFPFPTHWRIRFCHFIDIIFPVTNHTMKQSAHLSTRIEFCLL
jgi:hypothetical protein